MDDISISVHRHGQVTVWFRGHGMGCRIFSHLGMLCFEPYGRVHLLYIKIFRFEFCRKGFSLFSNFFLFFIIFVTCLSLQLSSEHWLNGYGQDKGGYRIIITVFFWDEGETINYSWKFLKISCKKKFRWSHSIISNYKEMMINYKKGMYLCV